MDIETIKPDELMNDRMIESARETVDNIRRVDKQLDELREATQKWRAERRKFVAFVRNIEKATGEEFLPKPEKSSGGKRGRRRDPNSLGSLILKALGDTVRANAAKLEARVKAEGYEFNGKTKPYARIHSELQRLKRANLVESADERGFYRLAPQPETVADEGDSDEGDSDEGDSDEGASGEGASEDAVSDVTVYEASEDVTDEVGA